MAPRDYRDDITESRAIRRMARGVRDNSTRRRLQDEADHLVKRAIRKLQRRRKTKPPTASRAGLGVYR